MAVIAFEASQSKLLSPLRTAVNQAAGRSLFWMRTRVETHVDPHDLTDRRVKLLWVIEIDREDVRPADVLLCVRVLGGHLRDQRGSRSRQNID